MVELTNGKVLLDAAGKVYETVPGGAQEAYRNTIAYSILQAHNSGTEKSLQLKFDALVSPDNNYVSILQTAAAVGLEYFPVPYVLSNCHNSLCAVGGTINEDDHMFGLDNARKRGGIFVPPYRAVIHQYMRECMAGGGKLILGSDSHTRYGAIGTMGFGEGGGELVRQLMGEGYSLKYPEIIAVVLEGSLKPGVGSCDAALAMIAAVFKNGFVRNKVLEFIGPGIAALDMDTRMGIDVMSTESGALSSIWCTDEKTQAWLTLHGRGEEFKALQPAGVAEYDGMVRIDLSTVEPMLALPYHPSNALPIRVFRENAAAYLAEVEEEGNRIKMRGTPFRIADKLKNGELYVDQGLISGCAGGIFGNLAAAADILRGHYLPANGIQLGVHPASQPVMAELLRSGIAAELISAGATLRPAMCGSCFGVMDVPADNQLSVRHVTRNYPNREGSKPGQNQMAATILMDARSIAATMRNGGRLTAATELDVEYREHSYHYDPEIYAHQVCDYRKTPDASITPRMGPNIAAWPEIPVTGKHLLVQCAGAYEGSLTTDELVPSGEATAWRSNPIKLSEFTMQTKDANYVPAAKKLLRDREMQACGEAVSEGTKAALAAAVRQLACREEDILLGSFVYSDQIGDGSSREQAASNQKVLGGLVNLSMEYTTKRYRSNCINWGIVPLRCEGRPAVSAGDWLLLPDVKQAVDNAGGAYTVYNLTTGCTLETTMDALTDKEKEILKSGCLINYYKALRK